MTERKPLDHITQNCLPGCRKTEGTSLGIPIRGTGHQGSAPPKSSQVQFSRSVVSDSATPWTAARQASLSITTSRSLLKLVSIESVMPAYHLILCRPLLLPSIFPSIRVSSNVPRRHDKSLTT